MKKLTMKYIMIQIMHEKSKGRKTSVVMMHTILLYQDKGHNIFSCKDIEMCYYCYQPSYMEGFVSKTTNSLSKVMMNYRITLLYQTKSSPPFPPTKYAIVPQHGPFSLYTMLEGP